MFDRKFLRLPSELYSREDMTCSKDTEKQILKGTHVLSSQFKIYAFMTLDEKSDPLCRCIVTVYENDDSAYLGFFEAHDDFEAVKLMADEAENLCVSLGKYIITGPVDSSFWIKYRMKTDMFTGPFAFEPYNREYYFDMWQKLGFIITEKYFSSFKSVPAKDNPDNKLAKRYESYINGDYRTVKVTAESFETHKREFFELFSRLYSSFPAYKPVSFEQFSSMYSSMPAILNPELAKFVFKDDEMVAFSVCVPDYRNYLSGNLLLNLPRIMKIRKHCSRYIVLYCGADRKGLGLASALAEDARRYFAEHKCRSVGALMHEGKITNSYYSKYDDSRTTYVLMRKNLRPVSG